MSHDQQAQRLREIDDLLAECQRHYMTGVRVSYAQLRALRDEIEDQDAAMVAQVRETVKLREQLAPMLGAIIEPEFRKALLWLLWHHQGGSSRVGQPIRSLLGIGKHDRLTDCQLSEAKSFAVPVPPAAVAVPDVAKLSAEIKRACSYYRQAGRVGSASQILAKQHEERADKIIEAALLAATPAPVAQKVPEQIPEELFDSHSVYLESNCSANAVTDVLDTVVRMIRRRQRYAAQAQEGK